MHLPMDLFLLDSVMFWAIQYALIYFNGKRKMLMKVTIDGCFAAGIFAIMSMNLPIPFNIMDI